ncbi:tyrosine-type recombinase/integrase [Vagococcus carniphilus]|uniref:tyrosine-type recombinase/integrase n=1 Tax=Vagococcus carniphilus TaxID=218144 RepID=UPI002890EB62|nr:tyrosine-type recombinase/integrase [Vagococcus carniphilus]MDT2864288.1 tyrosine-type recombinase/integrase [Vagococcus carniphilus]
MAQFTQYELKNGTKKWMFKSYLGVDEVTGKEIRTTRRGFDTLKEAKLEEKRLQHDYLTNGFQKAKVTTFNEAYEMWFTQYKNTVKESTWAKTGEMFVNHILPAYGDLRIEKIDVKYCQKTINKWFDHTKTKYKRMHNYVSNVFEYAISLGIVSDNPTKRVTVPKVIEEVKEETEFNYYTKDELINFLNILEKSSNQKAYSLFYLLAFSGLRQGEALALTWSDIDFELKTLTVSKTLTRGENSRLIVLTPKTKKSARTMALDDGTLSVLKRWRKAQRTEALKFGFNTMNKNQLIFTNIDNSFLSPAKPRKWLIATQEKNNLKKITVHGFRHTHCSLLFEAGASIQEVQERLGHSDVKTTMNIYTHVTKKTKKETALKFANYINIV